MKKIVDEFTQKLLHKNFEDFNEDDANATFCLAIALLAILYGNSYATYEKNQEAIVAEDAGALAMLAIRKEILEHPHTALAIIMNSIDGVAQGADLLANFDSKMVN